MFEKDKVIPLLTVAMATLLTQVSLAQSGAVKELDNLIVEDLQIQRRADVFSNSPSANQPAYAAQLENLIATTPDKDLPKALQTFRSELNVDKVQFAELVTLSAIKYGKPSILNEGVSFTRLGPKDRSCDPSLVYFYRIAGVKLDGYYPSNGETVLERVESRQKNALREKAQATSYIQSHPLKQDWLRYVDERRNDSNTGDLFYDFEELYQRSYEEAERTLQFRERALSECWSCGDEKEEFDQAKKRRELEKNDFVQSEALVRNLRQLRYSNEEAELCRLSSRILNSPYESLIDKEFFNTPDGRSVLTTPDLGVDAEKLLKAQKSAIELSRQIDSAVSNETQGIN